MNTVEYTIGIGIVIVILICLGIYVGAVEISSTMAANNIHYTKVIIPLYVDNYGTIIDSNENSYKILTNEAYSSGKNFTLNKYKINNAIRSNKSVTLIIQTICMPLKGCVDAVSGVE